MDEMLKISLIQMRKMLTALNRHIKEGGAPYYLINMYDETDDVFYELLDAIHEQDSKQGEALALMLSKIN